MRVGAVGDGLGLGLTLGLALGDGLGDGLTDGLGDGDGSTALAEDGMNRLNKTVITRRNFQLSGLGLLIGLSLTFPLRIEH